MPPSVRVGLEVFLERGHADLAGKRVGLITNPTGVDRMLRFSIDLLAASDHVQLVALFGPEHGLSGEAQAGEHVAHARDPRTGLPVISLYGASYRPPPSAMKGLDALIFDLQDLGVRYSTYLSTLALAFEAAVMAGILFVIFDRPNPLNGVIREGKVLESTFASFVGIHEVPIRHGLTAGEFGRLLAAERGWPEPLVIQLEGWDRRMWFDETGLPWVPPSPNLPTLDSLTLYPGTCLVEGTNCSEGRGTTRPFEIVGAPWIDPFALADNLTRRDLPGVRFRPTFFVPTFSKHAGQRCGGVQIHLVDREALRPVELGVHLLQALRQQDPEAFSWRRTPDGAYFIDLLAGTDRLRHVLDAEGSVDRMLRVWDEDVRAFSERLCSVILY